MSHTWKRSRIYLVVLLIYVILAVVLTWPLATHLLTHIPGSYNWAFDEYTFVWNSWWFRYSLLNLGESPLHSNYIFYPITVDLILFTYNFFNVVLSFPLQPFLPLTTISNLTFLFSIVMSGFSAFLLAEYLLRTTEHSRRVPRVMPYAAFFAGLIYGFSSYRMVYAAIGHHDIWSTAWIPLYTLYLLRTIREPGWRNALLAGLFFALAMYCEMIFGVLLAMMTIVILLFVVSRRGREEAAGGLVSLFKRLALAGSLATLLYSPMLAPILREMSLGYALEGWGSAQQLSVDLMGFVSPTGLNILGPDWTADLNQTLQGTARFSDINTVFLGWATLALAAVGAVRYRQRVAVWITCAVVFMLFALGPVLQIFKRSTFDLDGLLVNVPLPFIVLHYIPVIMANRVPNRFSAVLMLALAILVAFAAYWILSWAATRRRATTQGRPYGVIVCCVLIAAPLLFEHWSVPLPLTDSRIPAVYDQVAADPDDLTILQLPLGWRNSFGQLGAEDTRNQYHQVYHQKRLLAGNTSRNTPFKFDYYEQAPIVSSIIALESYGQVDADRRAADRASADEFLWYYNIRYVIVSPPVPDRPPYTDTYTATLAYVEEVLPMSKIYDQDGWRLYRVNRDPDAARAAVEVDFGSQAPLRRMALGEGWAADELIQGATANWAVEQEARVLLPSAVDTSYRLTVRALPFDYPGAEAQTMALVVNGHRLERITLAAGWGAYSWEAPAQLLEQPINDLRFELDHLAAPADVLPGNGAIGATGVEAPVAIEVNSDAPADLAYITAGEGDLAKDGSVHRAGYNVAVIDQKSGRLVDQQGFDTTPAGEPGQAAALADFIASIPAGRIVVVAMQGDGAAGLTDAAVAAFRTIGGQADPRGTTGGSHIIVGVKGAAPGTALEAAGLGSQWLRVAPDRRTLGVAVDTLLWEQIGVSETKP
ncbi:MAG: hypothetical protein JXM73_21700 [Anaerolineae bacterium]|nr:hypothetical protein [Anaerolineae bacterium]